VLHIRWCYSSRTSRSWWITQSTQHYRRGCNNIPSFLQRNTPIACSLCEGWTRHDLYILVTAPFCCDRKPRAARAQSFASWQQATIEIMLAISLTIACPRYTYDGVILHTHPGRGESHNQRNTTGEVATLPLSIQKECKRVEMENLSRGGKFSRWILASLVMSKISFLWSLLKEFLYYSRVVDTLFNVELIKPWVNTLLSDNKTEREIERKRAGLSFLVVNLGTPTKLTSALAELSYTCAVLLL